MKFDKSSLFSVLNISFNVMIKCEEKFCNIQHLHHFSYASLLSHQTSEERLRFSSQLSFILILFIFISEKFSLKKNKKIKETPHSHFLISM